MYSGKMAFAVKVAGKVLREHGEQVFLPFGSEYTLLIKNLNNRRACVTITLDGKDVIDGGLIVNANSTVELERFVNAGQMDRGNRFKFIERTGKVEATRGIKLEDGILRVEFEFEKEYPKYEPKVEHIYHHHTYRYGGYPTIYGSLSNSIGDIGGSLSRSFDGDTGGAAAAAASAEVYTSGLASSPLRSRSLNKSVGPTAEINQAGITVPGSISEQKFTAVNFTGDGITSVMVLKLLGETETAPVKEAVVVKKNQKCSTCEHVNKAKAKFCSECGTGLEIV